jgi:hypothetical protein
MFTHITKLLTKGENVAATLTLERGGPVEVQSPVIGGRCPGPGAAKGDDAMGGSRCEPFRRVSSRFRAASGSG